MADLADRACRSCSSWRCMPSNVKSYLRRSPSSLWLSVGVRECVKRLMIGQRCCPATQWALYSRQLQARLETWLAGRTKQDARRTLLHQGGSTPREPTRLIAECCSGHPLKAPPILFPILELHMHLKECWSCICNVQDMGKMFGMRARHRSDFS